MSAPTIGKLRAELRDWQEILNIPEWAVSLRWGSAEEMEEAIGLCYWCPEELAAQILLKRTQDNAELTLVHELLHLVLEGHKPATTRYSELHERAINRISEGLWKLKP